MVKTYSAAGVLLLFIAFESVFKVNGRSDAVIELSSEITLLLSLLLDDSTS